MNAKQGFHWKTIENKPDNWEKLQKLIQSSVSSEDKDKEIDKFWSNPLILKTFIELYPEIKDFFPKKLEEKSINKNKNNKKISLKHTIHSNVEEQQIKKDLQNIRFDKSKPSNLVFSMEISFVLMIFLWNYYMFYKKNFCVSEYAKLDAIISINRIIDLESTGLNICEWLKEGILKLQENVNKKINDSMIEYLFKNPILIVESTANSRKKSISLYNEQKLLIDKVINSVITNKPLLIGNQMPTGTGKTFLAVPLAQKLNSLKKNKTLLFACSNELVNEDIACTALLGDDLHLWMAKLIRDEHDVHVLVRPYKRCFPAQWKKVYKTNNQNKIGTIEEQWKFYRENTGKNPDILVADLEACYLLLKNASLIGNPFIAYIDEFISDNNSNELMGKICKYLPKQSVLLSAILPSFDHLSPILDYFYQKYDPSQSLSKESIIYRVNTIDVPITCVIIDNNGYLRMPHHQIKNEKDLDDLLNEIRSNPRIRRCYTAKHVYFWAKSIEHLLDDLIFSKKFTNIGKINNKDIIEYAIDILYYWKNSNQFDLWKNDIQSYRPRLMNTPDTNKLFTDHTYLYEGKTLYISDDIMNRVDQAINPLFKNCIKWSDILQNIETVEKERLNKLERLENLSFDSKKKKEKNIKSTNFNKLEKERMISDIESSSIITTIPLEYVLNSKEHFKKFHPNEIKFPPHINRYPSMLPESFNEAFDDQSNLNMSSGIGIYNKQYMTSYQRNLVMSIYKYLLFMCSGKDIVFGTNLPDLVNIYICKDFATSQSISTLYQLMGRVGRLGRSYHANIILEDEISVEKILSLDSNVDFIEIQFLLEYFKQECLQL